MNALSRLIFGGLILAPSFVGAETAGDRLRHEIETSAPGATLHVAAGEYDGPFIIAKSIHLLGASGAILRGDGKSNVVSIRAPDVELAGFIVRGSGRNLSEDIAAIHITGPRAVIRGNRIFDMLHGVYVRGVNDCRITDNVILGDGALGEVIADPVSSGLKTNDVASAEFCNVVESQGSRGNGIHLWNSSGHFIARNTIKGTRDGIYFSFTRQTRVVDNVIMHVRYGLHYMYSDENVFERNHFSENAAGAALMFSKKLLLRANHFVSNRSHRAYGLLLQSIDDTRIENNTIEGNTVGLYIENGNHDVIHGNRISGNYVGLRMSDSTADSQVFENSFTNNIHPLETNGANGANLWAVDGRGNHWDDALSIDLNRDGIADLPHREPDLFGSWRRSFPAIGLLSASPGERLLRLIHSRLNLASLPGVTDPKPLVKAVKAP